MGFLRALSFLTRLPIFTKVHIDEYSLAKSVFFFPVVGMLIGFILGCLDILSGYILYDAVRNVFLIIVYILITGGLHLDGLADTIDGIFGGHTKEKMLAIMRDSRMGTFGAIALFSALLLKFSLFISLPDKIRFQAIVLAPIISRWIMVAAIAFFPYAREGEGKGKAFADYTGTYDFILSSFLPIVVSFILAKGFGLLAVCLTFLAAIPFMLYINSKIKGMTGDTYGAVNEMAELLFLIVFSVICKVIA